MLNNLSIAQPYEDRIYISNSGTLIFSEDPYRDPYSRERNRSRLKAGFTFIAASGLIDKLYYEIYDANIYADDVLEFLAIPSGHETVTIAEVTYTFVSGLTAVNQVLLKNDALSTAISLYRTVNAIGSSGNDYYSGQTANPLIEALLPDNPLYFRALASGIVGNTYSMRTHNDSTALYKHNKNFTKGTILSLDPIAQGYVAASGTGNGDYILDELPFSPYGLKYYVHLYFTNYSGLQALNINHDPVDYWKYTDWFTGRTTLASYAEVSGIIGTDLYGSKIASSGKLQLGWDNMNSYSEMVAYIASPLTAGGGLTQATQTYDSITMGQNFEYVVFVFKSTSGSAPIHSWPRPADTNGIWYYAGKTSNTYATLNVPIGTTYSIWVGFGTKNTLLTSGLPINSVNTAIYIED